jgi:hypothetical protein
MDQVKSMLEAPCRACEEACTELLEDEALGELQKLAGG